MICDVGVGVCSRSLDGNSTGENPVTETQLKETCRTLTPRRMGGGGAREGALTHFPLPFISRRLPASCQLQRPTWVLSFPVDHIHTFVVYSYSRRRKQVCWDVFKTSQRSLGVSVWVDGRGWSRTIWQPPLKFSPSWEQ